MGCRHSSLRLSPIYVRSCSISSLPLWLPLLRRRRESVWSCVRDGGSPGFDPTAVQKNTKSTRTPSVRIAQQLLLLRWSASPVPVSVQRRPSWTRVTLKQSGNSICSFICPIILWRVLAVQGSYKPQRSCATEWSKCHPPKLWNHQENTEHMWFLHKQLAKLEDNKSHQMFAASCLIGIVAWVTPQSQTPRPERPSSLNSFPGTEAPPPHGSFYWHRCSFWDFVL